MANRDARYTAKVGPMDRIGSTLVPREVKFTAEGKNGAPDTSVTFRVIDGVPEVVDFRLTTRAGGRGVRSSDLREWQLGAFALNAFLRFAEVDESDPETPGKQASRAWTDEGEGRAVLRDLDRAGTGKRQVTREELEEVANTYRAFVHEKPGKAVEQLGYPTRTAARRIQQAREAGLLPPTKQGRKQA